jgi:hypothetical protein
MRRVDPPKLVRVRRDEGGSPAGSRCGGETATAGWRTCGTALAWGCSTWSGVQEAGVRLGHTAISDIAGSSVAKVTRGSVLHRLHARGRVISAVAVTGLVVSGCGGSQPVRSAMSAGEAPSGQGGTCRDVSGRNVATSGRLSMGSFAAESLRPHAGTGAARKVWVASQRRGSDTAVLVVTDPKGHKLLERRKPGVASAKGVQQFFPGLIRVRLSGRYRLDLSVGPDTMCVTVEYHI